MIFAIEQQTAWAIGLFEGEGSIVFGRERCVSLVIQMTDKDIIERFYKIIKKGSVTGPYKVKDINKHGYKNTWRWGLFDGKEVRSVLLQWIPVLGNRRQEKALLAIERLKNLGERKAREFCYKGHPWNKENTYISPKRNFRMCRECRRIKLCR